MTVFHFLTHNMCNVDDLDESDIDDLDFENDILEDKNYSEVDFKDDIVDDEKSDEEKNPTWKMIITLKKTRMN